MLEKVLRVCHISDISRFSPQIDRIFSGKHLVHFLVLKMKDSTKILIFDAEQVYLKPQVTNVKDKDSEVRANLKPHTLEKVGVFKNPLP